MQATRNTLSENIRAQSVELLNKHLAAAIDLHAQVKNDLGDGIAKVMRGSSNGDPDLAAQQDDIAALKRDVASLIEHLKVGATNSVQSATEHLDDGASRFCRNVAAEGERSVKAIGQQIEEQPLVALLIALGVGYIGGRLLSR